MKQSISIQEEYEDAIELSQIIQFDGWFDEEVILVNCMPEYSSLSMQLLNHSLSHSSSLHEIISHEMPLEERSQVWFAEEGKFCSYNYYLTQWSIRNINKRFKYLFFITRLTREAELFQLRRALKGEVDYRIACIYRKPGITMYTDYIVKEEEPTFCWELNNKQIC